MFFCEADTKLGPAPLNRADLSGRFYFGRSDLQYQFLGQFVCGAAQQEIERQADSRRPWRKKVGPKTSIAFVFSICSMDGVSQNPRGRLLP